MADDLHDVARYLNDMRLCFIALTVTGYLLMIIYGIIFCVRRNRRRPNTAQTGAGLSNNGQVRRGRWDYQMENRDYQTHAQTDDLVSVRSDGQGNTASYMGRNHHRNPPSFMRHGMNHAQQTARLMADQDGGVVKHQIPHITTDPPSSGDSENSPSSKVPELLKGSVEM
ncbi:unnamed protein product [Anisakis simplex]|uniref:Secreted protein n=1 Tax=Anisakis simplex TaxID=6269 RepID=A0A0M3J2Y2_ANISI|nr:unnamed protein product [Anisakis simplex]